ncbi:MAG: hypothetical protein C0602_10025 [Denitrovibrio sp.]|nr:MAG: hypothetical protein C0602_10025 [Denitrovibrio sp.]
MEKFADGIIKYVTSNDPTLNLLLILVIVWTTGVICRKLKQPAVLGELTAGIIFGPALLGVIVPNEMIEILSELGVFFLMFYAGLETDPAKLKQNSYQSSLVGIFGFIIPFFIGYAVCTAFGMGQNQSLFVAMGLSITAIAVNARVLHDMGITEKRVTPVIIGASIIDDVMSLAFFTAIIDIATKSGSFDFFSFMILTAKVLIFFAVTISVGLFVYPKIGKYFSGRESKGFTFALVMAFLFGVMAEIAGLHIIIGAYMAGLFVREGVVDKDLFNKISDRFVSITYGFIGPIFFVSLSFHVTFDIFRTDLLLVSVLLFAAILGKFVGGGAGALLGKMNRQEATIVGFALNGRGAVELVIASVGLKLGIINDSVFSILVLIAFVTTMLPPLSLSVYLKTLKKPLP